MLFRSVKALHDKVNSLLSTFDLGSTLDGMLLHSDILCVIRYEPTESLECGTTSWIEQGREGVEDEEITEMRTSHFQGGGEMMQPKLPWTPFRYRQVPQVDL